jgi:IclR family pca regulon transcriptional regulator
MTIESSRNFIQALERGLAVIKSFSGDRRAQTVSDVAEHTGTSRAAARRLLLTLSELGYVKSDGREFTLTPKVLSLGYSFLSSMTTVAVAHQHMERLERVVQESVSMSILDDTDTVYLAHVPTRRIVTSVIAPGTRFPAYPTSTGRVLLAGLPDEQLERYFARVRLRQLTPRTVTSKAELRAKLEEVRSSGYALVDEELEAGVCSIAAPITSPRGHVTAALKISGAANRMRASLVESDLRHVLMRTAQEISSDGYALEFA